MNDDADDLDFELEDDRPDTSHLYERQPHHPSRKSLAHDGKVWTGRGAKIALYAFLCAFVLVGTLLIARVPLPKKLSGWLGYVVCAGAVVDGFRRTYLELWGRTSAFVRWGFLALLAAFMIGGVSVIARHI